MAQLNCQDDIKQYVSSSSSIRYNQDLTKVPLKETTSPLTYIKSKGKTTPKYPPNYPRRAEAKARYPADSFRSNYDYYDSSRHSGDYLYPVQHQVSKICIGIIGSSVPFTERYVAFRTRSWITWV